MGVLVAISVPIFTSQLAKARLATNQANARSAVSAAEADYLQNGFSGNVSYVYTVSSGTAKSGTYSGTSADSSTTSSATDISSWKTGGNMDDDTYDTWYVTVSESGVSAIGYGN